VSTPQTRKRVTVLFSDVTGSTSLGEQLDPEAAREVIQRYFAEMRSVIERHGGTVEKFIGDAVMAVFGVPMVHEDDALRAVRAAAEMQAALDGLNRELQRDWNIEIQARIGVNTGEVVAADPGSGSSFVSGDAVNVAARLEQAAAPGEVLLGEPTYRLVRTAVIADALAPLALKGKAEPLPAYRLTLVEPGTEILPRRFDSPLVGRTGELRTILDTFQETESTPGCRLLTVVGHPGVGKSRLTHEVVASLGDRARVLRGRCLPYGEGITFWPVVEALQAAAGLDDVSSPEDAIARIAASLPADEDPLVAERLAALAGVGAGGGAIQESFWAIRRWLEHQAADRSALLVFDDIQWAEPTFLDLVQYLVTFATNRPILLVCLARPELLEMRPDWGQLGLLIRLEPLGSDESKRLMANLLDEAADFGDVGRQIVGAAGGNPLFIEEMLRMLVDDGLLAREADRWVTRGDLSHIRAPETVQAVIAARLDRLDPAERAVLQHASVVGEVFWWGAVADLSDDADPAGVGRSLQALVRKDLIRPGASTFAGEDAFRFGHLLIRDVAYESLPKKRRADLHARFASWVQERTGERAIEYEEIVGYHAEQAHRYLAELGPLDQHGIALAEFAGERLASSGTRSFDRGDLPAAAHLLGRASSLLPRHHPTRLSLLPTLASALEETGPLEQAEATLTDALESGRAVGDESLQLLAATRLVYLWLIRSPEATHEKAALELESLITRFEELQDDRGVAEALLVLGIVRFWAGRCKEALSIFERALDHAERAGDRRLERGLKHWMGLSLVQGSTPAEEAFGRVSELLRGFEEDRVFRASTTRFLAELEAMRGHFPEAWSLLGEGMSIARELGLVLESAGGVQRAGGYVALLEDDLQRAEQELRSSVATLERIGDTGHLVSAAADLGLVMLETAGRESEALELARSMEAWLIEDDVDAQVRWAAVKARALARLGELDEAERLARHAVAVAWATEYSNLRAISLEALAEVLHRTGRTDEAAEALREVVAVYEGKGNVVSAATARKALTDLAAGTNIHPS
jgi:class 3 adenylate cyclase/tetratricopeptide (TPR) repeat protein